MAIGCRAVGASLDWLVYLSTGLTLILAFIGVKLMLHRGHGVNDRVPEISTNLSLVVIVVVLTVTTVASLLKVRRDPDTGAHDGVAAHPGTGRDRPARLNRRLRITLSAGMGSGVAVDQGAGDVFQRQDPALAADPGSHGLGVGHPDGGDRQRGFEGPHTPKSDHWSTVQVVVPRPAADGSAPARGSGDRTVAWAGEHRSGHCGIEHPGVHEPRMQRLVPAAAAGHQSHL